MIKNKLVMVIVGFSFLIMTGCSNTPVKVRSTIIAEKNINKNIRNQPSPVVLKIFQLKSINLFNKAGYLSLTKFPKLYLKSELIKEETIIIRPNQSIPYKTDMSPKTRFIGVVGLFRNKNNVSWKTSHKVSIVHFEKIDIKVEGNSIKIKQSNEHTNNQ